jgi:uncharacterized membrane protein YgdD (TMEM256/DUF423 family)
VSAWLAVAAVNGALAVLAGAFAAHGLEGRLDAHALDIFQTSARYHMYHALALGLAALAMRGDAAARARLSAWLFLSGIVLFCGSLYILPLAGPSSVVFVTPIGGVAFLGGWLALAWTAVKLKV